MVGHARLTGRPLERRPDSGRAAQPPQIRTASTLVEVAAGQRPRRITGPTTGHGFD
ncbi:hypothetical protein [Streptomyces lavendulae]|uniref:hypothetical protein n=1 Tax=Streptomyces lavendulae TaxID=1914 RepID=UPI0033D02101